MDGKRLDGETGGGTQGRIPLLKESIAKFKDAMRRKKVTLTYSQATGIMTGLPSGPVTGYSGFGVDKNSPASQESHGTGPIPQGLWLLGAASNEHPHLGPYVIPLTPADGTETFGRSDFFIHGDSISSPGTASHGCIILPRETRESIVANGFTQINVVA